MKQIILHTGEICLIDDDDFDKVSKYKWYLWQNKKYNKKYARAYIGNYKQIKNAQVFIKC